MTEKTGFPAPTTETVLPCVPREWATTSAIFQKWLGPGSERLLSRAGRDRLRAETYFQLDRLYLGGRVGKRQVTPTRCEWRRLGIRREDRETTNVEAAARFERDNAL